MSGAVISADGVALRFDDEGSGAPALVLVHGWSCDRSYWRAQVPYFARRHRVVTVDLAGHGESRGGRERWTVEAFGADVASVVQRLDLGRVVLVGHSMGGDVVTVAATLLGAAVDAVVWVDTYRALGMQPPDADAVLAPLRADFADETRRMVRAMFLPSSDPALVDWVVEDMAAAPPDVAVGVLEHVIPCEAAVVRALRSLTAPVFALNSAYRVNDAESLARHGVTLRELDGVGHFPMLEDPDGFNAVLADVLATLGD